MEKTAQRELEIFFEYEKMDTLEEFILNFEPIINNSKDQIDVIKYLIILFRREKEELNKTKNEYLEDQYSFQVHKQIRMVNKIINYLQEKQDYIEKNIPKELKSKKEEKILLQKNKRQRVKNNKPQSKFSEEVLSLSIQIENGYKIDKLEINQLIEMLKYYQYKKEVAIKNKNAIQNQENHNGLNKAYEEIKFYTNIINQLIATKKALLQIVKEDEKKETQPFKLPISFEQLSELDELFNVNIVEMIKSIDNMNKVDSDQKLNEVFNLCLECKKILLKNKNELYTHKRQIKKLQDEGLMDEVNKAIKCANIHMDILNNLLNYLKYYQRNNITKTKTSNLIFADEIEINNIQKMIEQKMIEGRSIDEYELNDILFAIGHYIKNNQPVDKKLLKYAKEIFNQCSNITIEDENILTGIYYIWDAIKYRLANTPKEDKNTREILKDIRILFDYVIKNYKVDSQIFNHDYLFDIVDYFLKSEDNYSYLKRLVEEMPNIVNVRHIKEENGEKISEHIVLHIVNKFILNYKKMLKNKDSNYINKDYLKSIYLLFIRSYAIYLTNEEKHQIDMLLGTFMNEVNKNLTSSRRKNAVKQDVKEMYSDKFYTNNKNVVLKDISESRLEWQMNNFSFLLNQSVNRKDRIDLTDEYTFLIESEFNAYSIIKTENEIILKIHVIDLYDPIVKNSELDKYMYNQTLQKKEIDSFLYNQVNMSVGNVYPTITYEITFDSQGNYKRKNGHIDKFKVYQSKIEPKVNYIDSDLTYSKENTYLKSIRDLYRVSLIKNHGNYSSAYNLIDLKNYFEKILNQGISEYFKFNRFPFIYSGIKTKSEQASISLMNDISHILSRLNEEDFNTIYSILDSNVDEFHYSINEFNGEYDLSIQNPVNYVGISIQRILHELVFTNRHNEEEYEAAIHKFKKEFKELIMYLNYYNNYIDKDILKQNKGKIKKIEKILF